MKVNMNKTPDTKPEVKKKPDDKTPEPVKKITFQELIRTNKFWIVLSVILFFVFLFVNGNMNSAKTYYTVTLRNLKSDTAELESAIDDVKAKLDEKAKIEAVTLTQEEEQSANNNAAEQGELVAKLQNTYKTTDVSDSPDEFNANVEALNNCFDDTSKDARVPWYGGDEYVPGTWEFASKASFTGNTAKVLWLCKSDKDGILLAYCIATYSAETKLFSGVEYKMTKYAEASANPNAEDTTNGVASIIDSLKKMVKNGEIESDDGELDKKDIKANNEVATNRNSLKDAAKEEGKYDSRYDIGIKEESGKGGNPDEAADE